MRCELILCDLAYHYIKAVGWVKPVAKPLMKISRKLPKAQPNANSLLLGFAKGLHPTYKICTNYFNYNKHKDTL